MTPEEQTTDVVPAWHMTMCLNENQRTFERDFASVEEWEAWLRVNHPAILREWSSLADPWVKQYGTGYYWSAVTYAPRKPPVSSDQKDGAV